ncbi:CD2 antigen cytoplasmic tail-binding protein 2 homolog holn1 isoform X2 [Oratosquilla oratoria]
MDTQPQRRPKRPQGAYDYDDDEDYVPTKGVKYSEREDVGPLKKQKHTLDSDEEEDDELDDKDKNYDVMKDEDIYGQEARTIDFEGETKITPFNMKEEMEEGHFDGDGFYHFKKDNDIKDAWLDDIDWVKVKKQEENVNKYGSDIGSDDSGDEDNIPGKVLSLKTINLYKEMLEYLKPHESVAKALKRLGGNKKMSSAQKWKMKKAGKLDDSNNDAMKDFLQLTEFANKFVEMGNMDIYQETYEMINLKVKQSEAPAPEPAMDMFADETAASKDVAKDDSKTTPKPEDSEVRWEYKWENTEDAEVHGPFNTEQMIKWQDSGFFSKGVFVRNATEDGPWYNSQRIEFDLYI